VPDHRQLRVIFLRVIFMTLTSDSPTRKSRSESQCAEESRSGSLTGVPLDFLICDEQIIHGIPIKKIYSLTF
jgi:hypothetical protein